MEQEYLTIQETAALLRVNPRTVRRWIGAGKLPHIRIGQTLRVPKRKLRDMEAEHVFDEQDDAAPDYAKMSKAERRAYAEE